MMIYRGNIHYDDTMESFYFITYDPDPNGEPIQPSSCWMIIDMIQPPPPQNLWPRAPLPLALRSDRPPPVLGAGITFPTGFIDRVKAAEEETDEWLRRQK